MADPKMSNENENKIVGAFVALLQAGANYLNAKADAIRPYGIPTTPVADATLAPTSVAEAPAALPADPAPSRPSKAKKAADVGPEAPADPAPATAETPKEETPPPPPPKKKAVFCPKCGAKGETAEAIVHEDDCEDKKPAAAPPAEIKKENGKKMGGEEMMEEIKKAVMELAQKGSREKVVEILTAFGVKKASDVPVAKHPEFLTALRAAITKTGK